MTLIQRIKSILGFGNIREDILSKVSDQLQIQIGFNNVREELTKALEKIAKNDKEQLNFVLLGQQGLGKTIAARDLITNYLFAIKRISRQSFSKIEPSKLDKENFIVEFVTKLKEGKNGVVFIDEINNLRELEGVFFTTFLDILKSKEFSDTAFVISSGAKSWIKLKDVYAPLSGYFENEIYFRPYSDEELSEILKDIILKDHKINLPTDEVLSNLINEMKAIRSRQGQLFENASELNYFYYKCLKKASDYLKSNDINEDIERLSLKNFASTFVRR